MKKINLNDALGKIDDKIIEKSIETDSFEKLNELRLIEKRMKREKIFKYSSYFASAFAVIILGIFVVINKNYNDENNVLIPNPMISIDSLDELEKYLGISSLKLDFKEIDNIIKYNNEVLGQVTYKDGSVLRISKDNNDNSGIYGSRLRNEITINNVNVKIYSFEELEYAVWYKDGYSYSYRKSSNENITEIIEKVIGEREL